MTNSKDIDAAIERAKNEPGANHWREVWLRRVVADRSLLAKEVIKLRAQLDWYEQNDEMTEGEAELLKQWSGM